MGYLTIDQCEEWGVYYVEARNFAVGIYRADKKDFLGIRFKFNYFLDTEFHWDTGAPFGTAKPLFKLCDTPIDIRTSKAAIFGFLMKTQEELSVARNAAWEAELKKMRDRNEI